jgi:hypothetical protein
VQDGNNFKITATNPKGTKVKTFVADGSSFETVLDKPGEEIKAEATAVLEDGVLTMNIVGVKGKMKTVRSMDGAKMILLVTDVEKNVTMKRYFKKA